jgi:hypothetical protein
METCECGVARREFWLWRDAGGEMHASRFPPSNGGVRAVFAATARDALWSAVDGHTPKHDVTAVDDPTDVVKGRCVETRVAAEAAG